MSPNLNINKKILEKNHKKTINFFFKKKSMVSCC